MNVTINGEKKEISQSSLDAFLKINEINPKLVIIEHNKTLYKCPFPEIIFQNNDQLEIIQFMGGG